MPNSRLKSLRHDYQEGKGDNRYNDELPVRADQAGKETRFINKVQESLCLNSFGNDRNPFYSQYDREQANDYQAGSGGVRRTINLALGATSLANE